MPVKAFIAASGLANASFEKTTAMTTNTETRIKEFFTAYEARFNAALNGADDIDGVTNSFADCFIEASPFGVNCSRNDEQFRKMIPQGNAYYRQIGTKEMRVTAIDTTQLDKDHHMAKVHWHSVYEKEGKTITIDFSVIYMLQDINDRLTIFAYIAGDEQGALKEQGII